MFDFELVPQPRQMQRKNGDLNEGVSTGQQPWLGQKRQTQNQDHTHDLVLT